MQCENTKPRNQFPTKTSTGARPSKHSASSGAPTFRGNGRSGGSEEESKTRRIIGILGKGNTGPCYFSREKRKMSPSDTGKRLEGLLVKMNVILKCLEGQRNPLALTISSHT